MGWRVFGCGRWACGSGIWRENRDLRSMNKRTFLKSSFLAGAGLPFHLRAMADWIGRFERVPAGRLAADEDFWAGVRAGYRLNPDFINLENGYYCIQPSGVLE